MAGSIPGGVGDQLVGVAMVHAARLVEHLSSGRRGRLERLGRLLPIATAGAILVAGFVLTGESVGTVF